MQFKAGSAPLRVNTARTSIMFARLVKPLESTAAENLVKLLESTAAENLAKPLESTAAESLVKPLESTTAKSLVNFLESTAEAGAKQPPATSSIGSQSQSQSQSEVLCFNDGLPVQVPALPRSPPSPSQPANPPQPTDCGRSRALPIPIPSRLPPSRIPRPALKRAGSLPGLSLAPLAAPAWPEPEHVQLQPRLLLRIRLGAFGSTARVRPVGVLSDSLSAPTDSEGGGGGRVAKQSQPPTPLASARLSKPLKRPPTPFASAVGGRPTPRPIGVCPPTPFARTSPRAARRHSVPSRLTPAAQAPQAVTQQPAVQRRRSEAALAKEGLLPLLRGAAVATVMAAAAAAQWKLPAPVANTEHPQTLGQTLGEQTLGEQKVDGSRGGDGGFGGGTRLASRLPSPFHAGSFGRRGGAPRVAVPAAASNGSERSNGRSSDVDTAASTELTATQPAAESTAELTAKQASKSATKPTTPPAMGCSLAASAAPTRQ
ncbi:hypothetical protein T492DRAFT_907480 [Pavlovales sp. CCMP2436]|nr:hypothetical protein T492DRAFT_907480 [Pavlovales sp. CCMP2436]